MATLIAILVASLFGSLHCAGMCGPLACYIAPKPGSPSSFTTVASLYQIGRLIAERGWVLLNGGRPTGVMSASAQGCRDGGGLSVGILFDQERERASEHLDIVIPTGMGAARNIANVSVSRDQRGLPSHCSRRGGPIAVSWATALPSAPCM